MSAGLGCVLGLTPALSVTPSATEVAMRLSVNRTFTVAFCQKTVNHELLVQVKQNGSSLKDMEKR